MLVGYNFAPLVFRDRKTGITEVDLALANDVREQNGMPGEDLTERVDDKKLSESLVSNKEVFEGGVGRQTWLGSTALLPTWAITLGFRF